MKPQNNTNPMIVKECFDYDEESGVLTRTKAGKYNQYIVGKPAGTLYNNGYLVVNFNGRRYYVHRLIWAWMTGKWPSCYIDHINGIKTDNNWKNLREATTHENQHNRKNQKNCNSKYKGVYYSKQCDKYIATIMLDWKRKYIGSYSLEADAAKAWNEAALKYHGEFALLNKVV